MSSAQAPPAPRSPAAAPAINRIATIDWMRGLELGLLFIGLAALRTLEPRIGIRENGVFFVFGQTAMFFYLVHRLVLEVPATSFGLRGVGDLATTDVVAAGLLAALYPACLWYRRVKAAHPDSFLKYI